MIDAHHHLWDLSAVHYPWLAAKGATRFFGDPRQSSAIIFCPSSAKMRRPMEFRGRFTSRSAHRTR